MSAPEKEPDGSYNTLCVLVSKVTQCLPLHSTYWAVTKADLPSRVKIRLHLLIGQMSRFYNHRTGNTKTWTVFETWSATMIISFSFSFSFLSFVCVCLCPISAFLQFLKKKKQLMYGEHMPSKF